VGTWGLASLAGLEMRNGHGMPLLDQPGKMKNTTHAAASAITTAHVQNGTNSKLPCRWCFPFAETRFRMLPFYCYRVVDTVELALRVPTADPL